jgi:general L-amino acid transport system permease protein
MRRRSVDDGGGVGPAKVAVLYHPRVRAAFYQAVLLATMVWLSYEIVVNARANLEAQGFRSGFGFLANSAGFGINQTLISYSEADSYGRVFLVGLLNTLLVAGLGIVFASTLGLIVGIARLSPNWLVARLAGGYVELLRNLPLLFQILFWYLAVLGTLPGPRQSLALGLQPIVLAAADAVAQLQGVVGAAGILADGLRSLADFIGPPVIYLNNRGLILPQPILGEGASYMLVGLIVAMIAVLVLRIWARRRQEATGAQFPVGWAGVALVIGLPAAAAALLGVPIELERPELRGFNFIGGIRIVPEFLALLIALSTYTAAFIAEVVRAGILAVPKGQSEAALALGFRRGLMLRLIILPQALRVIIPPLTNQYLNLTKNSSLAVAIGYPDLFAVFAGTTLNQTHQAIEIIAITMAVYLAISLVTSLLMNLYDASVRIPER